MTNGYFEQTLLQRNDKREIVCSKLENGNRGKSNKNKESRQRISNYSVPTKWEKLIDKNKSNTTGYSTVKGLQINKKYRQSFANKLLRDRLWTSNTNIW